MSAKLSPTQEKLLQAIALQRKEAVSKELNRWGLRSAIAVYGDDAAVVASYLGFKSINYNRIRALVRAGMIEVRVKKSHTVTSHVNPWTRSEGFYDHYETTYFAKLTEKGALATRRRK